MIQVEEHSVGGGGQDEDGGEYEVAIKPTTWRMASGVASFEPVNLIKNL